MSHDAILRTCALVAAAALVAAPYWRHLSGLVAQAAKAANAHAAVLGRLAAAGLIVAAAWGVVPLPQFEAPVVPEVVIEAPSPELQALVAPIRTALAGLPAGQRALWAATWDKAATVVEAEGATSVPVFTDTPALRVFTQVALDVAWRRLGGNAPGGVAGLKEAVETAMRTVLGLDSVPVTGDVRSRYGQVARAIGWAATTR